MGHYHQAAPACSSSSTDRSRRSPTLTSNMSPCLCSRVSPHKVLFTFHACARTANCACCWEKSHRNREVILTGFSFCFQGLKQHTSFQMLPGHPDVSWAPLGRLHPGGFTAPLGCSVCAGWRAVCCTSHPNHNQSRVFPGYVNSPPHTETHTHKYKCMCSSLK